MSEKITIDINVANDAMLAIKHYRERTGDDDFDFAYYALEQALSSENVPKLSLNVSVKDTELFKTMLKYTEALFEILSGYELSEADKQKLNAISGDFFSLGEAE